MKIPKKLLISLMAVSFISVVAFPAQGQVSAQTGCELVESVTINDIEIPNERLFDPTAAFNPATNPLFTVTVSSGTNPVNNTATWDHDGDGAGGTPEIPAAHLGNVVGLGDADANLALADMVTTLGTNDWGSICLVNTINKIVNWVFFILLTVAFFLIVIAAFIWTTSAGDATKQQTARNMIIAALVGVVIAILARLIPAVVLGIVT